VLKSTKPTMNGCEGDDKGTDRPFQAARANFVLFSLSPARPRYSFLLAAAAAPWHHFTQASMQLSPRPHEKKKKYRARKTPPTFIMTPPSLGQSGTRRLCMRSTPVYAIDNAHCEPPPSHFAFPSN
jgi:hypothetical protein